MPTTGTGGRGRGGARRTWPANGSTWRRRWRERSAAAAGELAFQSFETARHRPAVVGGIERLEDRGEVRGGRFISELIGEQFALPVAVDSLRAARNAAPTGEVVTISAADPLNLVGIIVPGERVPAISGRFVTFRDGIPIGVESPRATAESGVA